MCVSQVVLVFDIFNMKRGAEAQSCFFYKPEQVVNGNQIYLGKWMRWIPSGCLCVCGWGQQQCRAGVLLFFRSPSCWPDFLTIFACAQTGPLWLKGFAHTPLYPIPSFTDSLSKYKKTNSRLWFSTPLELWRSRQAGCLIWIHIFQSTCGRAGQGSSCKVDIYGTLQRDV